MAKYDNLKSKAISIEGGEGSGKGTLIRALVEELTNNGVNLLQTREPGGNKIAEQIREVIVSKDNTNICPETEALLFAASRAQLMREVIFPAIDDGKTILFDRFVDSSYVYQGYVRGLEDDVRAINRMATAGWNVDKTIYLDIEPEKGLARIFGNNRETNRLDLEGIEFHKKVREGYLELAKNEPNRIVVINADQEPEKVLADVLDVLMNI